MKAKRLPHAPTAGASSRDICSGFPMASWSVTQTEDDGQSRLSVTVTHPPAMKRIPIC